MMLNDMASQDGIYRPGPYWQEYSKRIAAAIQAEGLASFRSSLGIAKGYADVFSDFSLPLMAPGWKRSVLSQFERSPATRSIVENYGRRISRRNREAHRRKALRFRTALGDWLQDFVTRYPVPPTRVGDPQRTVEFSGGTFGELYLRDFAWISEYSSRFDFRKIEVACEIGGGFGSMAHTLLHIFPNIRKYVYLDIPPNLYVGTQYLKTFFGDAVVDYAATRRMDEIGFSPGKEREILAVCPWQIEKINVSTDLFWNSSSFQEMPEDTVSNYARHLSRFLHQDSNVCLFVYNTRNTDKTLGVNAIRDIVSTQTRLRFEAIDTRVIDHIVPGICLLGRNG